MARDHTPQKEEVQQVVEREINLNLINAKLNEALNLLYKIAEKTGVEIKED